MSSSTNHILVVDDDPDVLGTLTRALTRDGFDVSSANSGPDALDQLKRRVPDLVILDVMMPGMTGFEVCKRIRADSAMNHIPVLFLTARGHTDDIVAGLDAGGDDYVVKPFELIELQARVRALLRRSERDALKVSSRIQVGHLILDSDTYRASIGDQTMQLTFTEHRLLRYLMEHINQALSPGHLLEAVWSYPPNTGDPDLVRAHIRNLRSKLQDMDPESQFIKTIHGVGYMMNE
ncbi:MAG: response regulator transcription factor [Anaerolineae bacterium]|nr:MAG: response regulator transcription factor [Anaerolineae bacterium]MBZ0314916.1 response regulator transcription factor [Anaerolineae bacterium]